jgi:predicted DNA-binding transcriptional regulator AlpA
LRHLPRRVFRYPDLCELGLVNNWTTLNNWIAKRGFPPGHMVGRCRVWTEREVFAWIESQPTENKAPLKGIAKKAKAEADARRSAGVA